MAVVPISIDSVRINQPVPFALRDSTGLVLVARGGAIGTEERRQQLIERGVFIDNADADAFKKAVVGKMDSMVRDNTRLGLIAKAEDEVDAAAVERNMATPRARRADTQATWDGLAVKMATALREPAKNDFLERISDSDNDLLGLLATGADVPLSVSGGLTFAGAPIRNYMMHAACEMSTRLRDGGGKRGLLFANGGFMTEAHAIALGSEPFDGVDLRASDDAQPQADALRGAIPAFDRSYTGGAMLETYSVSHDSDGEPTQGTVVARTDTGARMFFRVPVQDRELLEWLTAGLNEPVGMRGEVRIGSGGIAQWTLA